jgi:hypothetical protein
MQSWSEVHCTICLVESGVDALRSLLEICTLILGCQTPEIVLIN